MVVALKVSSAPSDSRSEYTLTPGDVLTFGRATSEHTVDITVSSRADVSRNIGTISVASDHWCISNHSSRWLGVVSVDEGGAFVRIAPGRIEAPIPFEICRVVWPHKGGELVLFEAFSMDTRFGDPRTGDASQTATFAWKKDSRHFLVLLALCEPQLRNEDSANVPGIDALVHRLKNSPGYPEATVASVNAQIEYLAVKCGKDPDDPDRAKFDGQKRLKIVRYAQRFGLVRWEDLAALGDPPPKPGDDERPKVASGGPLS